MKWLGEWNAQGQINKDSSDVTRFRKFLFCLGYYTYRFGLGFRLGFRLGLGLGLRLGLGLGVSFFRLYVKLSA